MRAWISFAEGKCFKERRDIRLRGTGLDCTSPKTLRSVVVLGCLPEDEEGHMECEKVAINLLSKSWKMRSLTRTRSLVVDNLLYRISTRVETPRVGDDQNC